MFEIFNSLDQKTQGVIIGSLFTGFFGVIAMIISKIFDILIHKSKIKSEYVQELYKARLNSYIEIFGVTEKITRFKKGREKIAEVRREVREWKKSGGLLLLGENSWNDFYVLEEALEKLRNYGDGDKYSDSQISKIWKARNDFRKSIKMDDLGLYYSAEKIIKNN